MDDSEQDMMQDNAADAGRGTDSVMAHMSLGEVVIPRAFLDDPQVLQMLQQVFEQGGADMAQYTVGDKANSINPETGYPEFGFGKIFKKVAKIAAPFAPLTALIPGVGLPLAAALSAGANVAAGKGIKGAVGGALGAAALGGGGSLLGGALGIGQTAGGALLGGAAGGFAGGTKGALLGAAAGGLAPNLSDIGSYLSDASSGALSGIGKATGLGDIYNSASGALGDFGKFSGISDAYNSASGAFNNVGGAISGGIDKAYDGSLLQSGYRSGSDALKSIGIGTGSESLGAGVGASGGGGLSTYAAPPTNAFGTTPNPYTLTSSAVLENAPDYAPNLLTSAVGAAAPAVSTGVSEVAKSPSFSSLLGFASPLASALLGTKANNQAKDALLTQQNANTALLDPYQNFSFTPGDLTQDPGYQFNLQQGTQAQDRAQGARGNYFSGQALKEAQTFGQGLADNTYNTAFQRALQTQNAGLQAAGAQVGVNENIGNIKANSATNTGNLYSGALGSILGGNSFTNSGALQGGGFDFLSQLLRRQAAGV